jgi:outer membrane receptor for Fe3+-dicitrate
MNNEHVYIGNHYSFPTPSSKYRTSAMGGFFDVFHEIFPKYREGNQYRVTATSALIVGFVILIHLKR